MKIAWERIAANFMVGFFTAFAAISLIDGLPQAKLIEAGAIGGILQGGLAASKDLLQQTEGQKKGSGPLLAVF